MKNHILIILNLLMIGKIYSQEINSNNTIVAQPIPDRTVYYKVSDEGVAKPIIWGLDLAWLSESNIRRGVAFMGKENVDVIRSSFIPTQPLLNDNELQGDALSNTNLRISILKKYLDPGSNIVLNSDHPSVNSYYKGNAENWAKLIEVTAKLHQDAGFNITTVSPFNEPDYSATGQGTIQDFYNICGELKNNSFFDGIRISGGNTLNNDKASEWYNFLKDRLDEGNTHQLAGGFDSYANFYQEVRENGDHATNDELHNVMEAMVGVEYGMQTGIWWGTAELARGEFVKASDGVRLGYNEHRPNWTAASVYRAPSGKTQAFVGSSERQAVTTTYRFVSTERDVFYDGHGPQREYTVVMPGGTGYQQGQSNAETVVNITWGDDIQPVVDGRYIIVNRSTGKVLQVDGGSLNAGANLVQGTNIGVTHQQWNVKPVYAKIGGDFSYVTITAQHSGKSPDVLNFSLNNGGNIIVWDDLKSGNQQWYLDYAEDGWFYIRSRHSAMCLNVTNSSTSNVYQWEKNGGENQQWRFLPVDAPVEFDAPEAPSNLTTTENSASIQLNWPKNIESDVVSYNIYRSTSKGADYNTIARNVSVNSYVDNTVIPGVEYFYVIKAVDKSLNTSMYSNEVSASAIGDNTIVAHYKFDGNTVDSSINQNNSSYYGVLSTTEGKIGSSIKLNGRNNFVQLPTTIANHQEITVATWVYFDGGSSLQHIFDFGSGESDRMFLTPNSASGELYFGIKTNGVEESLSTTSLSAGAWHHVAVTLNSSLASLYVDGVLVDESNSIVNSPLDFKPALNYIGRSQYSGSLFDGNIDDFRVYNYALTVDEIKKLVDLDNLFTAKVEKNEINVSPNPTSGKVDLYLPSNHKLIAIEVYSINGKLISQSNYEVENGKIVLDLENELPGIYFVRIPLYPENTIKIIKK